MFKKCLVFTLVFLTLLLFAPTAYAREDFSVKVKFEYKFESSGLANVTKTITITNLVSDVHATNYELCLKSLNPKNIKAYEGGIPLAVEVVKTPTDTKVKVNFKEKVIGFAKSRTFVVTYSEDSLANKNGDIWEIVIPKIEAENTFENYEVFLYIPDSFGNLAYLSPKTESSKTSDKRRAYYFDKRLIGKNAITLGFGDFQIFSFKLGYHLQNQSNKTSEKEIVIPPDTSTQKVFYESMDPEPANVFLDEDGNWLAKYKLLPNQKIDIQLKGQVKIFATPRKVVPQSQSYLLETSLPSKYWQSNNPDIKFLAENLKSPEKIYNYVTNKLSYDYQRVDPSAKRLGAVTSLANPDDSTCMEFTDLFIALSRAAGIPAREINGYAYSRNPQIQPLSMVNDVLHSWPEYWDETSQTWIPVDPTWGSTTKGVDYFDKLDLKHFAFVIHGKDPETPLAPGSYKLAENPQKDVYVEIAEIPEPEFKDLEISYESLSGISPFSKNLLISVKNKGSYALYDIYPEVTFDAFSKSKSYIQVLPPFSSYKVKTSINYGVLGRDAPSKISVKADESQLDIPTEVSRAVAYQMIIFSFFLITVIITIHFLIKGKNPTE